jgi:hypothetical protein
MEKETVRLILQDRWNMRKVCTKIVLKNLTQEQFVAKPSSLIDLHEMYKNKEIANTSNTKFLGHFLGRII